MANEIRGSKESLAVALKSWHAALQACLDAGYSRSSPQTIAIWTHQAKVYEKLGKFEKAWDALSNIFLASDSRNLPRAFLEKETKDAREKRYRLQFTTAVRMAELMVPYERPPRKSVGAAMWLADACSGMYPPFWDTSSGQMPPRETVLPRLKEMTDQMNKGQPTMPPPPSFLTPLEVSVGLEAAGTLLIKLAVADDIRPPPSIYGKPMERNVLEEMMVRPAFARGIRLLFMSFDWAQKNDAKNPCRAASLANNIADGIYKGARYKRNLLGEDYDDKPSQHRTDRAQADQAKSQALDQNNTLQAMATVLKDFQDPTNFLSRSDFNHDVAAARTYSDGAKILAQRKPKDPACQRCLREATYNKGILLDEMGWGKSSVAEMNECVRLSKAAQDWDLAEKAAQAMEMIAAKIPKSGSKNVGTEE